MLFVDYAKKGFTEKILKNKKQENKQLKNYLNDRAITELESITTHDLKAYVRVKQKAGYKLSVSFLCLR